MEEVKKYYQKMKQEESSRLLYVALTRARNMIFICGCDNNRVSSSWYSKLSNLQIDYLNFEIKQTNDNGIYDNYIFIEKKPPKPLLMSTTQEIEYTNQKGIDIHKEIYQELLLNKAPEKFINLKNHVKKAESMILERSICGILNNEISTIQPDCILLFEDEIHIIDFKSDIKIDPSLHEKQLGAYKKLIEQIYQKPTKCFLYYSNMDEMHSCC